MAFLGVLILVILVTVGVCSLILAGRADDQSDALAEALLKSKAAKR